MKIRTSETYLIRPSLVVFYLNNCLLVKFLTILRLGHRCLREQKSKHNLIQWIHFVDTAKNLNQVLTFFFISINFSFIESVNKPREIHRDILVLSKRYIADLLLYGEGKYTHEVNKKTFDIF